MENKNLRYYIYARKSTEGEDRQMQSIEDQVEILTKLAKERNLYIKKVYKEAKTAKKPDNREVYTEMMSKVKEGKADGILCWKLNRLARNPVDGGQISWMLQKSILKSIQTHEREYLPTDNVLMMSVEFGMANQFLIDLSEDVKRGMEKKIRMGWANGVAPIGYLNHKELETGISIIISDPERFDIIKKMWETMLTGNYNPMSVLRFLNDDWGFRTRRTRKSGGNPLSRSGLYKILTNPFYAGMIRYKNEEYPGKHEPMISREDFDRVQKLLNRKLDHRYRKHHFPFRGIIRCGGCGSMVTASKKYKFLKSTNKRAEYVYHHCGRTKDRSCKQKAINASELNGQIDEELSKITILPKFKDWALDVLNESNDQEIYDRQKIQENQHRVIETTQKELDSLTQMRYREIIDDDRFIKEKNKLEDTIENLEEKLKIIQERSKNWLQITEGVFEFATHAREKFINSDDILEKNDILQTIGTEFILLDGKLELKPYEWYIPIQNDYKQLEKEYLNIETAKNVSTKVKTELLDSVRTHWFGGWDDVGTWLNGN